MRIFLLLLAAMVSFSFQACTVGGDDDYHGIKDETSSQTKAPIEPRSNMATTSMIASRLEEHKIDNTSNLPVVIKMKKQNSNYVIPMKINGFDMNFIMDTIIGFVSTPDLEVPLLYKQINISHTDIHERENFADVKGKTSKGTVINLKEVSIGGRIINNIQALIVQNADAHLLLGQSAIREFGIVTMDYEMGEITFW